MATTRIARHINAPPTTVHRALVDPRAVATWKVPDGMTVQVHEFHARDGGVIRVVAEHGGLPSDLSPTDNETGWRMALDTLAALVESA